MFRRAKYALDRLRRPEYTGENRCTPCTLANLAIAAVASAAAFVVAPPLGALVFATSLAAIYLRGYLVPGTPALTKRYFPDRVLRAFDESASPSRPDAADDLVEPEAVLEAAGVLEPHGDDLRLTPSFEAAWRDGIESLAADGTTATSLARILGADPDALTVAEYDGARVAEVDGGPVAQWESEAALLADLAAEPLLADAYDGWDDLSIEERGRALLGLRVFLTECPACGGAVALSEETVESCCRSVTVAAATCEACDARLLELETPGA